jgi:chromosome segregation ATPase
MTTLSHHDNAVDELVQKLRLRDIAVQQLKERCDLIQEDYEHNFRLAQQQAVELQTLRAKGAVLEKQNRRLEAQSTALQSKLREADGEVQRQTQSLHATVESLRAQLLVGQTEHGTLSRKYADVEMQLSTLRQELQQQSGRIARDAETIRREAMMEAETRLAEKDRLLRTREEQTLRDVQAIEHRCVGLSSELGRVKELKETSDIRLEELTKTIARKEFLIQAAQEQLNETKKHHAQQLHKLELEAQGSTVLKEQGDKSLTAQLLSSQREVERRIHENELLEQKIVAIKQQHELELRRRCDEKDELIRGLEDKCRLQQDKIRSSESRCTELEDDIERLRRRIGEGKKTQSSLVVNGSLLEDKLDDLQRALTIRDAELARLKSESERATNIADRKEKEADELRAEFERRSWQDRVKDEMLLEKKKMEWREHGAAKMMMHTGGVAAAVQDPNLSLPYAQQQPSSSFATPLPQFFSSSQLNLSAIANEVKQQIQQQQSSIHHNTPPPPPSDPQRGSAFLHELSLLREQHQLEKLQLERRLQEVTHSARRQRNRVAMLEAADRADPMSQDDMPQTSSGTPMRSKQQRRATFDDGAPSTPGAQHLNSSRDGSASMSIYRDDQENVQTTRKPQGASNGAVASGLPPRAATSATSRVEELQRQLAESPLGRPIS